MSALKHLACYLKGTAECGIFLTSCSVGTRLQDHWLVKDCALEDPALYNIECYCDSNCNGCKTSRKSTSSGMVFLNGCLVLSLCKSQSTIALSSCEAELLAMTHMTAEAIMVCNLCRFLLKLEGCEVNSALDFIVYTDSSSKAFAQRRGVGRLKHVDLRYLWVQACVRQKLIRLKKVGTQNNVADLNTKNPSMARRRYLFGLRGLSEDQKKITISTTNDNNLNNPKVIRRIALILAGLLVADATSVEQVAGSSWIWMLLATVGFLTMILVWMVPGSRSRSPSPSPRETASEREGIRTVIFLKCLILRLGCCATINSDMEEDEPEREPAGSFLQQQVVSYVYNFGG